MAWHPELGVGNDVVKPSQPANVVEIAVACDDEIEATNRALGKPATKQCGLCSPIDQYRRAVGSAQQRGIALADIEERDGGHRRPNG